MNSVNVELAKEQVAKFLRLLKDNLGFYEIAFGNPQRPELGQRSASRARSAAAKDPTHTGLLRLHPLIEEIAGAVDPSVDRDRFKPRGKAWLWAGVIAHAERLAGILDQQETRDAIFESSGPRLQADRLHRWVWDAAKMNHAGFCRGSGGP